MKHKLNIQIPFVLKGNKGVIPMGKKFKDIEEMHEKLLKRANKIVNKVQKDTGMFECDHMKDRAKQVVYITLFQQVQGELNFLKNKDMLEGQQLNLQNLFDKLTG